MIDQRLVLIADRLEVDRQLALDQSNFEFADDEEFAEIFGALQRVCRRVVAYESPREFLENIRDHSADVVLSIWSGQHSRNRKALVPSICEAYSITYVGADTYTNVIAQDKSLSKALAQKFGFATPRSVLVDAISDLQLMRLLHFPVVVKPNFEGGSIGISTTCLVHKFDAAAEIASALLDAHRESVIVEEFVRGREVSYVLVGNSRRMLFAEAVELVLLSGDLRETIWSYEIKQSADVEDRWDLVTSELSDAVREAGLRLFNALSKVELIRIDGRLDSSGSFQLIELSPDAYLGKDGAVGAAYRLMGMDVDAMLEQLILNALQNR